MMDNSKDIKSIEIDNYLAVFNKKDLSLNLYYPKKSNCHDKIAAYNMNSNEYNQPHNHDNLKIVSSKHIVAGSKNCVQRIDHRPSLQKLSINVSNICNMACRYCYANGGTYYTQGELMGENTALNAITFAFSNFASIDHINFFGGEPTLNEKIIELIYKYVKCLYTRGLISHVPQFGITTNCYFISDHMLKMIHDYGFGISISLDGPSEIHDKLRIDKCGQKTYDSIVSNVNKIINLGITPEFECTYTREHYDKGISIVNLMDYFYDNFGCRILHCPIVVAEPSSYWFIPLEDVSEMYTDAIRYTIHNLMNGIPKSLSVAARILDSLENRTPIKNYCSAGRSSITINADGNVFPCFMLMNGKEYCLGNVNEYKPKIIISDLLDNMLLGANKWHNVLCQNCWAQPLCFGCLGDDIARDLIRRPSKIASSCEFKRRLIETVLRAIAEVAIDQRSSSAPSGII